MKNLYDPGVQAEIKQRLGQLYPGSTKVWGKMSPHQAVCHLTDAFRMVMGERPIDFKSNVFLRTFVRFMVVTVPLPWPRGVGTAPELDQERGGTPPEEFAADLDQLSTEIYRFVSKGGRDMATHPIFGDLSRGEWSRWAYRHLDHHLKQFGV